MGPTCPCTGNMLFPRRLAKRGALLSLTKPLHRCLGRSRGYFSEDARDPNLSGIKTNRVNIFPAASIPGLNISKHVKLTFLHRSRQGWRSHGCQRTRVNSPGEGPGPRAAALGAAQGQRLQLRSLGSGRGAGGGCYLLVSTLSADAGP